MNMFLKQFAVGGLAVGMAMTVEAAVREGTFTAIVTAASDPGQLSFGRDSADWVGRSVIGHFAYDVETTGVNDQNPAAGFWGYGDPSRNTDWVTLSATIDGVVFHAQPLTGDTRGTVTGGVVIADNSYGAGDWFGVQHSYAIVGGRSVVGFDVFGLASLFSYAVSDGVVSFPFPAAGATGSGVIEDLYEPGGVVQRHGLIRFSLTSLTFGKSTETLIAELLTAVIAVGPGSSLADKMAIVQAYYAAGDAAAACAELTAFENQVKAQTDKKLTASQAAGMFRDSQAIGTKIGCQ